MFFSEGKYSEGDTTKQLVMVMDILHEFENSHPDKRFSVFERSPLFSKYPPTIPHPTLPPTYRRVCAVPSGFPQNKTKTKRSDYAFKPDYISLLADCFGARK